MVNWLTESILFTVEETNHLVTKGTELNNYISEIRVGLSVVLNTFSLSMEENGHGKWIIIFILTWPCGVNDDYNDN